MKKIYVLLLSVASLFMVSCSNMEIGFEEDSMFYGGGILYIYLDDIKAKDGEYKVYINQEDTEVSLTDHSKTRFGIVPGQTNIQVVKGRQTASIDIFLQKSNSYYLKVMKNNAGKIELIQVQESAIAADAEETPLYVDENVKEETPVVEKAKEVEPIVQTQKTQVKKEAKKESENETTFSYDKNDGWE